MKLTAKQKWLAFAVVLLLPVVFFAAVVAITGIQCCSSAADESFATATARRPSNNEIAKEVQPDLIGIYPVPLHCPLVKGLGCGSESKSIMTRLEAHPTLAGAWLDHGGTLLAVLWKDGVSENERAAAMAAAFAKSAVPTLLSGEQRDAALRDFLSGTGWHRTNALDELSAEEAKIVATRWVGKITAIIPLPEKARDALHCQFAERMRRRFVEN